MMVAVIDCFRIGIFFSHPVDFFAFNLFIYFKRNILQFYLKLCNLLDFTLEFICFRSLPIK